MEDLKKDRDAAIASYAEGPKLLEKAIAGLSVDGLDLAESNDTWTIRQYVHHVADGDDIWKAFIKQAIGNPGSRYELQWYWDLLQNEWVMSWDYANRAIEPSLGLYRASRAHIVQLLLSIPAAWERSLMIRWPNGDDQEVRVSWVVEMQTQHVFGHVDDIRRARQVHGV